MELLQHLARVGAQCRSGARDTAVGAREPSRQARETHRTCGPIHRLEEACFLQVRVLEQLVGCAQWCRGDPELAE